MKRVMVLSLATILSAAGLSYAEDEGKEAIPKKIIAKSAVNVQEVLEAKKAELNNTEWVIELKPMVAGKVKAEKDTLHFADGTVSSANLLKAGYSRTNFTARLSDDNETLIWETMQTSDKDGVSFWRGDIGADGVMRGVLSKRDLKNNTRDFNFASAGSTKVAPLPPAVVEKPAAPAVPETSAAPAVEAPAVDK